MFFFIVLAQGYPCSIDTSENTYAYAAVLPRMVFGYSEASAQ